MDLEVQPDVLEAGKDDCQTPRRPLDQACVQLEPVYVNQAKRVPETRKTGQEDGKTTQRLLGTRQINRDINDLTSDTTWLTTAEDGSKWDAMEKVSSHGWYQIADFGCGL